MRCALFLLLIAVPALADGPVRPVPLLNVELTDSLGVKTSLAGFHLLNGEHRFQGYLGAAEIEVSYSDLKRVRVSAPSQPGARMRADLVLRSGRTVAAQFDEREGELLLAGFAAFGRVTLFFRDVRELKILGRTKREDLPAFGKDAGGVDVQVRDRLGVTTELAGFTRAAGESVLTGVRGATTVAIPLRILKSFRLRPDENTSVLSGRATLRDGATVDFLLPTYEENRLYRGEADFGAFRIRLAALRDVVVHRRTTLAKEDPAR